MAKRPARGMIDSGTQEMKVAIPSGVLTYPDAFARCGPEDETSSRLEDPITIVEVL